MSYVLCPMSYVLLLLPAAPFACRKKPAEAGDRGVAAAALQASGGGTAAGVAGEAYPVDDLLGSLRADVRPRIASLIGVRRVSDLTLYRIDVAVDPDGGAFRGLARIDYANTTGETLSAVVLRVFGNLLGRQGRAPPVRLSSAQVAGRSAAIREIGPTTFEAPLGMELRPGERVGIDVAFEGQAPRQEPGETTMFGQGMEMLKTLLGMGGGGIEGYGILSMGDGIVSLAAWYPVVAQYLADRRGFDAEEPSGIGDVGATDLANYRVEVRVPAGVVVASSGVLLAERPAGAEVVRTYGGAALRDFTVLVSRDYLTDVRSMGDVAITAYVPASRREFAPRILDYAAAALDVFERRFGPYTLTELDVAAAPLIGGAGGVEFPGLVTVATMLMQDMSESLGPLAFLAPPGMQRMPMLDEMFEFVVVHEVAHQWWHSLIGSDSVRHPFIDEALAQYSTILYFEDRYGAERAAKTGERNVKLNYLVFRLLGNPDAAADRPTSEFSGMLEYAALVYGKAPYYYEAVRRAIGDERFAETMRRYYRDYLYKQAAPESFARIAGEVSGRRDEIDRLHRRWLHETHGDADLGRADFRRILGMVTEGIGGLDASTITPQGVLNSLDVLYDLPGLP